MLYKSPGHYIYDTYHDRWLDTDYPLWLNLGYWDQATRYTSACAALADLAADAAAMSDGQRIVDAGCGFGEPARHWLKRFPGLQIISLNNNPMQADIAGRRITGAGLDGKIRIMCHDAVDMPVEDGWADCVIALESAFHFNTREAFIRRSLRALRPGGRLVIADLLPIEMSPDPDPRQAMIRRHGSIPEANMIDRATLAERVASIGYVDVSTRSIRGHVFPGAARLADAIANGCAEVDEAEIRLTEQEISDCAGVAAWADHNGLSDFVLLAASKP